MKFAKFILIFIGIIFICTGCLNKTSNTANNNTINEMDFYNKYVDELNKTSKIIEELQTNYNSSIPLEVKADDEINFDISNKQNATTALNSLKSNLLEKNIKISESDKQQKMESLLQEYMSKTDSYLLKYDEVGTYYANKTYQADLAKAAEYEKQIQQAYSDYQTAEENIYNQIEAYQETSPYKARLDSEDPAERINASIDLLTDETENLYNAYMVDWDAKSDPLVVKEKYQSLTKNKETTIANLDALEYSDAKSSPIKKYFDDNYIVNLNNYISDFDKFIKDYDAGLINENNVETYDQSIQVDFEKIIDSHNEIINLTNEQSAAAE